MKFIDSILNRITMYRVVLYALLGLLLVADLLSFFGVLKFSWILLIFSAMFIYAVAWITNQFFARVFSAPSNPDSVTITALILALIITPPTALFDTNYLILAVSAAVLAMASKYLLAIRKKHIFNPAALGVAAAALFAPVAANWWVGTAAMLPFTLIAGFLIVRKIRRFKMVFIFLIAALLSIISGYWLAGRDIANGLVRIFTETPIIFFATVMFTEPLTAPPTFELQSAYALLVGFIYSPMVHLGNIYSSPEIVLLVGNVFAYLVSPKQKLILKLQEVHRLSKDTYDFIFSADERLKFKAGQYLEWTLPHKGADSRGIRRYFTISSAPTENHIAMGVKFYANPSTFKKHLAEMEENGIIYAGQLAGDFVLPEKSSKKLAFIAGGIGITPFKSIVSDLKNKNLRRDMVLLYSNRTPDDIAYQEFFDSSPAGLRTVHVLNQASPTWRGEQGVIDARVIQRQVPDYKERTFYISGPQAMVAAMSDLLRSMGVERKNIKTDFFPGFA